MPRQLHSARAAAAMTLILSVAAFAFVIFSMVISGSPVYRLPPVTSLGTQIHNLSRGTMAILSFGYLAGIVGWLSLLALHGDGKHRLEALLVDRARANERLSLQGSRR